MSVLRNPFEPQVLQDWARKLKYGGVLPWVFPDKKDAAKKLHARSWLTSLPCSCMYSYGQGPHRTGSIDVISGLTNLVCSYLGLLESPDACNVNWYYMQQQGITYHADDEKLFGSASGDALIVSLSIGATMDFRVRLADNGSAAPKPLSLMHGDLVTMEGRMQSHYVHAVGPGFRKCKDGDDRLNLTWRWIKFHSSLCPCH